MNDLAVPDFFRRLWRLPTVPHRRGRKPTLDVETVVNTAVRLADEGGLEAATLPKVAEEVSVTAMSLYRHVGSKHELLQLMRDAASKPGTPAPDEPSGWRDGLRRWAVDLWSLYRVRPWLPHVPIYRAPSGPHQIAWLERGFEQLASTELDRKSTRLNSSHVATSDAGFRVEKQEEHAARAERVPRDRASCCHPAPRRAAGPAPVPCPPLFRSGTDCGDGPSTFGPSTASDHGFPTYPSTEHHPAPTRSLGSNGALSNWRRRNSTGTKNSRRSPC